MITRKKATITGLGTALMAGTAFVAWRWRKRRTANAYYNNINEQDIAWG